MAGSDTAFQGPAIHASRPAADAGCILFTCTTHGKVEKSDGTTWSDWLTLPSGASSGTPAVTLGTAAAAGSSGAFINTDATLPIFDATAPVTQAFSDAAAVGSAGVAARRDHRHGMPASPGGLADHGGLSGLADDDHPQYAIAGRRWEPLVDYNGTVVLDPNGDPVMQEVAI